MKLSNQAVGAIMMALQKGILDQADITGLLKNFEIAIDDKEELVVTNPPLVDFRDPSEEDLAGQLN